MRGSSPRASILLLVRGPREATERCIRSVREHAGPAHELIVAGPLAEEADAAGSGVDVTIDVADEGDLLDALRAGLAAARGDLVLILDDAAMLTAEAWAATTSRLAHLDEPQPSDDEGGSGAERSPPVVASGVVVDRLVSELGESRQADQLRLRRLERELAVANQTARENLKRLDRIRSYPPVRIGLAILERLRPLVTRWRWLRRRLGRGSDPPPQGSVPGPTGETLEALGELGPVSVVVPVHGGGDVVRRCVDALLRNTTRQAELIIVDDASPDDETVAYLDSLTGSPRVRLIRNATNLGFTRSVNRAIATTRNDVVVVNSDTEVPPRWLENLTLAAYSDPDVATVTAVSDNAGAFSVPVRGERNDLPADIDRDDLARLVARTSERLRPETPTANGFCMYVKRRAIEELGAFDEDAFPRGYGEENDLSMRARRAGWRNIVDDATLVYHERNVSFGDERDELLRGGREIIDQRYPEYTDLVRAFLRDERMERVRGNVAAAWRRAEDGTTVPRRVLYAIHEAGGGTLQTTIDLMAALHPDPECYILTSDAHELRLSRWSAKGTELVDTARLDEPLRFVDPTDPGYRRRVAGWLVEHGIELVHIRHLVQHTLDLPGVARALGIPVVLSFHEYYYVCPTLYLLDDQHRFCWGTCTPGQGRCHVSMRWIRETAPHLKHEWVYEWQDRVREHVLGHVDAFVTTSPTARDIYRDVFPELSERRFDIIEHGRDVELRTDVAAPPVPGEPMRVLVPGNIDVHKGSEVIREIRRLDEDGVVEFHFLGAVPSSERDRALGVWHGSYVRHEFADRAHEIRPSVVAVLSPWAETYSHVVTEAWAAGIPVVGSDLGAVGERVRAHGGGWVVPPGDASETLRIMTRIARSPDDHAAVRRGVPAAAGSIRTTSEMAADYVSLYDEVLRSRRVLESPATAVHDGARRV